MSPGRNSLVENASPQDKTAPQEGKTSFPDSASMVFWAKTLASTFTYDGRVLLEVTDTDLSLELDPEPLLCGWMCVFTSRKRERQVITIPIRTVTTCRQVRDDSVPLGMYKASVGFIDKNSLCGSIELSCYKEADVLTLIRSVVVDRSIRNVAATAVPHMQPPEYERSFRQASLARSQAKASTAPSRTGPAAVPAPDMEQYLGSRPIGELSSLSVRARALPPLDSEAVGVKKLEPLGGFSFPPPLLAGGDSFDLLLPEAAGSRRASLQHPEPSQPSDELKGTVTPALATALAESRELPGQLLTDFAGVPEPNFSPTTEPRIASEVSESYTSALSSSQADSGGCRSLSSSAVSDQLAPAGGSLCPAMGMDFSTGKSLDDSLPLMGTVRPSISPNEFNQTTDSCSPLLGTVNIGQGEGGSGMSLGRPSVSGSEYSLWPSWKRASKTGDESSQTTSVVAACE